MVAAAVIGGAALSAGATAIGSSSAADAQQNAASNATNAQEQMFNETEKNLEPYNTAGQTAENQLISDLPSLTAPVTMDEATLKNTPGYQFNLSQGLESVQNSAAARGLATSGAALKGAANYATGLADSTYQNQFNNAVTNSTNTYNRLMGITNTGESAAAGVGSAATATGQGIASNTIGAGNATAAADNAIGSSVSSGANSLGLYGYLASQANTPNPISGGTA